LNVKPGDRVILHISGTSPAVPRVTRLIDDSGGGGWGEPTDALPVVSAKDLLKTHCIPRANGSWASFQAAQNTSN
jgi:hypothetical protein